MPTGRPGNPLPPTTCRRRTASRWSAGSCRQRRQPGGTTPTCSWCTTKRRRVGALPTNPSSLVLQLGTQRPLWVCREEGGCAADQPWGPGSGGWVGEPYTLGGWLGGRWQRWRGLAAGLCQAVGGGHPCSEPPVATPAPALHCLAPGLLPTLPCNATAPACRPVLLWPPAHPALQFLRPRLQTCTSRSASCAPCPAMPPSLPADLCSPGLLPTLPCNAPAPACRPVLPAPAHPLPCAREAEQRPQDHRWPD